MIPSLVLILLAVAVSFFVLPNFAPTVLVSGSVVVLMIAFYIHWSQFGVMEYERSTWQYNLRKYSSYVVIGAILLGAYGFYAMNQIGESVQPMPPISVPTIGGGFGTVMKTASSRIHELMRRGRISLD